MRKVKVPHTYYDLMNEENIIIIIYSSIVVSIIKYVYKGLEFKSPSIQNKDYFVRLFFVTKKI